MTLDEAIAYAENVADKQNEIAFELNTTYNAVTEYSKECSKCAEDHKQFAEWLKDYKRLKERESCEDAVSRQAVLNIVNNPLNIRLDEIIKKLPSVTPQPKTGRWIYKQYDGYPECGDYHCSECDKIDNHIPAYCPYCGCAMIEPQESEDKECLNIRKNDKRFH